jgi:hypothetical protein
MVGEILTKVWEAKRRTSYKSVISGTFGSDFSLNLDLRGGR